MLLLVILFGRWIPSNLQPGLLFLSVLPSTIFSSTVFTANSGGDAGAALFNATLSNLIGVVITPLCAGLLPTRIMMSPIGSLIAMTLFLFTTATTS